MEVTGAMGLESAASCCDRDNEMQLIDINGVGGRRLVLSDTAQHLLSPRLTSLGLKSPNSITTRARFLSVYEKIYKMPDTAALAAVGIRSGIAGNAAISRWV